MCVCIKDRQTLLVHAEYREMKIEHNKRKKQDKRTKGGGAQVMGERNEDDSWEFQCLKFV